MPIPDYQTVMLPLLRFLSDGEEHSLQETVEHVSDDFALTDSERKELLPSGNQEVIRNRVGWARTYLGKAGLLDPTGRGYFKITSRGKEVLAESPDRIDAKFLERYSEFREFRTRRRPPQDPGVKQVTDKDQTPEEALGAAYETLRKDLEADLLDQVKGASPQFFERLVVELLVKMGYGGSRQDAGRAVGQSGDGGIDGIIKEDRLGLDVVYVQAKRWENPVGRAELQKFAGALQGRRARKGVFITTSAFTKDADEFTGMIDSKIVLIDGQTLAELMIDHNVGVSPTAVYEVKKIDTDYFVE